MLMRVDKPEGWYSAVVHVWDLPEGRVYIDLKEDFKREFLIIAKGNLSWRELAKRCKISYKKLKHFKEGHKTSLGVVYRILEYLKERNIHYSKREIERNINRIGGKKSEIKEPVLPFNLNTTDGAKIIAAIIHDGGIWNKSLVPYYTNSVESKHETVKESLNRVFGRGSVGKTNMKDQVTYISNMVGMILVYGIGLCPGNKVLNNPKIPEFLFNSKKEVMASYLRQAFDDDGSVVNGKIKNHKLLTISINTASKRSYRAPKNSTVPDTLRDIRELLKKIGINPQKPGFSKERIKFFNKKKYYSQEWKLIITGFYNIIEFQKSIGFELRYKQKALGRIINDLSKTATPHLPHGMSLKVALGCVLKSNQDIVDKNMLAKEMRCTSFWTKELLRRLENKGYAISRPRKKENEILKYSLTEKGECFAKQLKHIPNRLDFTCSKETAL